MRRLSISAAFLLLASIASGQTITAVSDTVGHGRSITISGSGFGTKSPAAPIKWDTFDDAGAVDGDRLATEQPEWIDPGNPDGGYYTSDYAYSGELSVQNEHLLPWTSHENFKTNYFVTGEQDTIFYSYYFRYVGGYTSSYAMNIKLGRINWLAGAGNWYNGHGATTANNVSPLLGRCDVRYSFWNETGDTLRSPHVNTPDGQSYLYCSVDMTRWNRIDFYKAMSDPGVYNGHIFMWNVTIGDYDIDDDALRTSLSGWDMNADLVALPLMYANQYDQTVEFALMVDDVYVDNTLARVELGNNASFFNCTRREMQIPSAWAADAITVTVNTGAFNSNDTAYLFVVNADGTPSTGYPVVIGAAATGGGEEPGELTAPTNLRATIVR